MPASRDNHAIGAIGNSRRAKHTRRAIAREIRERGKPDPLKPALPRCVTEGSCYVGRHTGETGCVQKPQQVRCWCGKPYDHDWPGKSEGQGHPR